MSRRTCILALAALVSFTTTSLDAPAGATDTLQSRKAAARRYLEVVPMRELIQEVSREMAASVPEEQRETFMKLMTERVRLDKLEDALIEAMSKNFTTEEIHALTDFYASPAGRSVMSKFGGYMADMMPAVQAEVAHAMEGLRPSKPSALAEARKDAEVARARVDMKRIARALEIYLVENGRYPESLRELVDDEKADGSGAGPYIESSLLKDPWGRDYFYQLAEDGRTYTLRSEGDGTGPVVH